MAELSCTTCIFERRTASSATHFDPMTVGSLVTMLQLTPQSWNDAGIMYLWFVSRLHVH